MKVKGKVNSGRLMKGLKGGKKLPSNARLLTERVSVEYDCGCTHLPFIQADSVHKSMNVEVCFTCNTCPNSKPISVRLGNTTQTIKDLKCAHDTINSHDSTCNCIGVAIAYSFAEFEKLTRCEI